MDKIEKIHSSDILQIFHLPPKVISVLYLLSLNLQTFCFINLSIHPYNNFLQSVNPSSNLYIYRPPLPLHISGVEIQIYWYYAAGIVHFEI